MGEKIVIGVGMTLLLLFLPYGLSMLLTGYDKDAGEIKESGIYVEYEDGGTLKTIDLEEYLIGVLAAEVPYDYEEEMLKAQAVVARTNARKLATQGSNLKSDDLKMGYQNEEEMRGLLGETRYQEHYGKIRRAVAETSGEFLIYQGNYIDALYHQVSIGQTASAMDVYGQDIPYLVSVDSSSDVESKDYMATTVLEYQDVLNGLNNLKTEVNTESSVQTEVNSSGEAVKTGVESIYGITSEQYSLQIEVAEKSEAGYVKKVKLGNHTISGEEFRQAFNIPSLYFYTENVEGKLRIVSLGKGHGLGLSQYGANQMARQGAGYKDILKHYYTGITIESIK